jgi:hypothetical protein
MNGRPIIIFSKHSPVCSDLLPYVSKSRIPFRRLCIDARKVRQKCKTLKIRVVPTIIEFNSDSIFFNEGFEECLDFISHNSNPLAPSEYEIATPVPKQQAPVPKQQAPVQRQQAPVPKQQAPVQRQQAPVQRQQAPVQRQQAPVQRQQAPVQKQQAPVAKRESSEPIDPGQESLDLSVPSKGVSSLSDLLPSEDDLNPHTIQLKKIEAFNRKKEIDAKRLEQKARESSEQSVKGDLVSRAQELQKQREATDIARERSRPKIPESASATLRRR